MIFFYLTIDGKSKNKCSCFTSFIYGIDDSSLVRIITMILFPDAK